MMISRIYTAKPQKVAIKKKKYQRLSHDRVLGCNRLKWHYSRLVFNSHLPLSEQELLLQKVLPFNVQFALITAIIIEKIFPRAKQSR